MFLRSLRSWFCHHCFKKQQGQRKQEKPTHLSIFHLIQMKHRHLTKSWRQGSSRSHPVPWSPESLWAPLYLKGLAGYKNPGNPSAKQNLIFMSSIYPPEILFSEIRNPPFLPQNIHVESDASRMFPTSQLPKVGPCWDHAMLHFNRPNDQGQTCEFTRGEVNRFHGYSWFWVYIPKKLTNQKAP